MEDAPGEQAPRMHAQGGGVSTSLAVDVGYHGGVVRLHEDQAIFHSVCRGLEGLLYGQEFQPVDMKVLF